MGDGLEDTLRTLVESGVDFGPVRSQWVDYLEARSQGYTSPWAALLVALGAEPLERSAVRSAGLDVVRSRMSTHRRVRGCIAFIAPTLASRWVGRSNG